MKHMCVCVCVAGGGGGGGDVFIFSVGLGDHFFFFKKIKYPVINIYTKIKIHTKDIRGTCV